MELRDRHSRLAPCLNNNLVERGITATSENEAMSQLAFWSDSTSEVNELVRGVLFDNHQSAVWMPLDEFLGTAKDIMRNVQSAGRWVTTLALAVQNILIVVDKDQLVAIR